MPIYEPLFAEGSYGYHPNRSAKDAILKVKDGVVIDTEEGSPQGGIDVMPDIQYFFFLLSFVLDVQVSFALS